MIVCPRCSARLTGPDLACSSCDFSARRGEWFDLEPQDSVEAYFDDIEFRYRLGAEQRHFWHRARRRLLAELLQRHAPAGARVLDVGCGCGHLSGLMTELGFSVSALDLSESALRCVAEQGVEASYRASVVDLPFVQEFDVVCAFDVIEHVPDHQRALSGLIRALRQGGLLLITVPAHPHLWGSWDRKQRHERRYRRRELRDLLQAGGLDVVMLRSFFALLHLPCLAAALMDRAAGGARRRELLVDQHHAMWNPGPLATLAFHLLDLERRLPWPEDPRLGTSLVAVARRPLPAPQGAPSPHSGERQQGR